MKFAYLLPVLAGIAQATVLLDFDILRGKEAQQFAEHHRIPARQVPARQKRDDTLNVPISNEAYFYLTTLKVGSGKQEVQVLVDTGSSDLWFATSPCSESQLFGYKRDLEEKEEEDSVSDAPTPTSSEEIYTGFISGADSLIPQFSSLVSFELANNPVVSLGENASNYYYATEACTAYGSFATDSSDSFKANKTEQPFYVLYGDNSYALGYWANDDVEIAGQNVESLSFGVAPYTDSDIGVLGIGLPGLEGTVSIRHPNRSYEYENLPLRLKNLDITKANAYSVWLGKNNASKGEVLFGGYDTSRFEGPLTKLPIINEYYALGVKNPIRTNVLLNGIHGDGFEVDQDIVALLDTGTTLAYLPQTYIDPLVEKADGVYWDEGYQYNVSCDLLHSEEEIKFKFSGIDIKVPLKDLIYPNEFDDWSEGCFLGVLDGGNESAILGDVFLRSAYAVFDFDNYEIALAQAAGEEKREKEGSHIVTISDGIPSATAAPLYSSTFLSDVLLINSTNSEYYYSTATLDHTTVAAESTSPNGTNGTGPSPWYHSDSGSGKVMPFFAVVAAAVGGALSFL